MGKCNRIQKTVVAGITVKCGKGPVRSVNEPGLLCCLSPFLGDVGEPAAGVVDGALARERQLRHRHHRVASAMRDPRMAGGSDGLHGVGRLIRPVARREEGCLDIVFGKRIRDLLSRR